MDPKPVSLLLVEDEPDLREALVEYFEVSGFAVVAVGSAAEALAQVGDPDLVLSDLTLPDQRGDLFLTEFHRHHPQSLLYVHSGDSTFVPGQDLQACGLVEDHVFAKPANLAHLVATLRQHLGRPIL